MVLPTFFIGKAEESATFSSRKWKYLLLALFFAKTYLQAQDTLPPRLIVKVTPSMLLDPDNTLALGAEIPLGRGWSLQQEVGWGNAYMNLWDERSRYADKNNWRFRTQLRYYFTKPASRLVGSYFALEYFRKEIFIRQYQAIGRQCNPLTGACAYFEEGILRTRRRVSALHAKFGYQWLIPDRMVVDMYIGAGLRKLIVTNNDPLGQVNTNVRDINLFNLRSLRPGHYEPIVSISGGFSLGILLVQKKRKVVPLRS